MSDIERALLDGSDEEYQLGGQLVGTTWVYPGDGAVEVKRLRQTTEREQGRRVSFPEVVLSNNRRFRVESFKQRIRTDLEPVDMVAEQIAYRYSHSGSDQ